MDPRVKSALLWGVVGGMSFLVAVQGYTLVTGDGFPVPVVAGVAVAVLAAATATAYLLEGRLATRNEQT